MRRIFLLTGLLALIAATTGAHILDSALAGQVATPNQRGKSKANEQRANSITGRVVNEAGQPIANVTVRASLIAKRVTLRITGTDDEGRFRVDDLTRGVYNVMVYAPGYTSFTNLAEQRFYRAGDTVNFTLTRGAAISGTVANSSGEPLVGVRVTAIRVRDIEGHAIRAPGPGGERRTDDRGVFRIYGLPPGVYIVLASGNGFSFYQPSPYDEDVPTYYPSSTRDAATPITLQQGGEATGIDIRYRGERGHAISGNIAGPSAVYQGSSVELVHVSSNQMISQQGINIRGDNTALTFAFYGVPDGEYNVTARRYGSEDADGGVGRVRVKVKGADVTGLEIPMTSYASIAGRIAIERISEAEQKSKCESNQGMSFDEILISANRDRKADSKDETYSRFIPYSVAPPTSKGEFKLNNIEAGRYHIEPGSIGDDWYIRAITLPAAAQDKPPVDATRNGVALKAGDHLTGMTVTITEGAAGLRGRVLPSTDAARLPDRLRVHLIPAEKEAADEALRFAEAAVESDGTFSLKNVAPGRYLLAARTIPEEAAERIPRHVAWDAEGRKLLRQEAETAGVVVELQLCQRVADHVLRYTPPAAKPAPKRKP
jgi:Carboxypeptidase regulatory-like domain